LQLSARRISTQHYLADFRQAHPQPKEYFGVLLLERAAKFKKIGIVTQASR
jgi:hypothetical protein